MGHPSSIIHHQSSGSPIRVLISYVTAGTGHRRAAEAIAETVRRQLPHATVTCVDLLTFTPRWFRWTYPRLYRNLVRFASPVWGWSYSLVDQPWVFGCVQPIRRAWNQLMARRLLRHLRDEPPDVMVATHFFPADCFASAKRRGLLTARLVVVITDLFPHRIWFAPEAETFVVGSAQTETLCRQRGIAAERLHAFGIPVGSSFTQPIDRDRTLRGLGLDSGRRTILMASGGMGIGPIAALTKQFVALESERPKQVQLIVVCGENERLRRSLERLALKAQMPIRVFGFVETMSELMQVSDLMVTKAGGLTIMEALAVGVPMMIFTVIPGQEELNARYVASQGAAIIATRVRKAIEAIRRVLDDPATLHAMRERARALAHPHAASEIVKHLIPPVAHGTT